MRFKFSLKRIQRPLTESRRRTFGRNPRMWVNCLFMTALLWSGTPALAAAPRCAMLFGPNSNGTVSGIRTATPGRARPGRPATAIHPSLEEVVTALGKLPAGEAGAFFETSWGPASQLIESGDPYGYRPLITQSYRKPAPFYNKVNQRAGGVALFHGSIFAEGYYRTHPDAIRNLMTRQTWLEWNPQKRTFTSRRGNPAPLLTRPYVRDGKIRLYRGLSDRNLQMLFTARDGGPAEINAIFERRDALFFSPDRNVMSKWATDGRYIEITLDARYLGEVYAGIEYDYVEVALLPEALRRALPTLKVHRLEKVH